MSRRILIPLPDTDFDVTEVAVPWRLLSDAGHQVVFATESGTTAPQADPLLITGVVFGKLGAEPEPLAFYEAMTEDASFVDPVAWADVDPADYGGLILPGGHAPGMKQYLEGESLFDKVLAFWKLERPVGAICHGTVVLARTRDPETGRSVLHDRRTTCLPKYLERLAYVLTFWRRGRYYRTYPTYVQDEVKSALEAPREQFDRGPINLGKRGTADNDAPAFVVEDGFYVSARWPGDAYLFTRVFLDKLS